MKKLHFWSFSRVWPDLGSKRSQRDFLYGTLWYRLSHGHVLKGAFMGIVVSLKAISKVGLYEEGRSAKLDQKSSFRIYEFALFVVIPLRMYCH
jgi:hypothetical protein